MKKWIIRIGIAVALVVVIAFIVVAVKLDVIVKRAVETVGPSVTKVDVKLENAHLSIMGGNLKLKGLLVGNPPGYKADSSIKFGSIEVTVKPKSLFSDKIVVDKVEIQGAELTIEGGLTDNNLTKIQKNMNDTAGSSAGANASPAAGGSPSGKKIQVTDMLITGTKVHANVSALGKSLNIPTITIPDIHLTNLGTGSDGITPGELSKDVMNAMMEKVIPELMAQGNAIGKGVMDAVGNIGKDGGTGAKDAAKGLKSLFGK